MFQNVLSEALAERRERCNVTTNMDEMVSNALANHSELRLSDEENVSPNV